MSRRYLAEVSSSHLPWQPSVMAKVARDIYRGYVHWLCIFSSPCQTDFSKHLIGGYLNNFSSLNVALIGETILQKAHLSPGNSRNLCLGYFWILLVVYCYIIYYEYVGESNSDISSKQIAAEVTLYKRTNRDLNVHMFLMIHCPYNEIPNGHERNPEGVKRVDKKFHFHLCVLGHRP